MTPNDIRTAIYSTLKSSWATCTDIAWPNFPYDPSQDRPWIKPVFVYGETYEGEIGEEGLGMRTGLFMIQVYVKLDTGTKEGYELCSKAEKLFRRKVIEGIMFGEPYTDEIGNEEGHWRFVVNIPFDAWVGESNP